MSHSETDSILSYVIPAQAGIQVFGEQRWIPAFAGMTNSLP